MSQFLLSGMCAVFVPVMAFVAIPSFFGRMAIVLLVGIVITLAVEKAGVLFRLEQRNTDAVICLGIYCGAMAAVAAAVA